MRRESIKKHTSRVSDSELFTRLYYYGIVQMHMEPEQFWLTPIGLFLDLWACHKQFLGIETPYREISVDDVIPSDS